MCKPSWADLPMAPRNNNRQRTSIFQEPPKGPESANTASKLRVLKQEKHNPRANTIKTSATRLTRTAFNAAFVAFIRVYQKLIKRYEHKPTPSQPKKSCKKLSAVTNDTIKKVKNDIYDINLHRCGSDPIYSDEYTCTQKETVVTTISIVEDNESKRRVQFDSRHPECIQGAKYTQQDFPRNTH